MAGLPALQGSESGQVRKEAATASQAVPGERLTTYSPARRYGRIAALNFPRVTRLSLEICLVPRGKFALRFIPSRHAAPGFERRS